MTKNGILAFFVSVQLFYYFYVYIWGFFRMKRQRPKILLSLSHQINQISPPPIIKHLLATQNDFGKLKNSWYILG